MKIRLAAPLQYDSIVDGEGIRTVLWTQGCSHNCLGCHNPETHSFDEGYIVDTEDIKKELKEIKYQDGLTLSGGDPLMQADACLDITKFVKTLNWNVWCYTGFTFEQLLQLSKRNSKIMELLQNIDVLIDGKFILEEKSMDLQYRGSRNQRLIDVQKSLKENKVIVIEKYMQNKNYSLAKESQKYMYV